MEKPVRVLHMINSLHFGGSQAFIMSVYRNIDRTRLQFDFVVTPEEEKDLYEEVRKMGGRIFVCPRYTFINHFTYLKWWEHFFTEHPEYKIIHGHVRSTSAIYLSIAKKHGLTTIAHSHSTSNGKSLLGLVKTIMQYPTRYIADYLFSCSDLAGKWMYGEKATKQDNYQMIPNGIDIHRFTYSEAKRKIVRQSLGILEDEFVIGHIGRFTKPKNHIFLLQTFSAYLKKHPHSRLLLVGDGTLLQPMKKACGQMNIMNHVIFTGARSNTEDYYQVMDVFAFPSLWEGLPVSVVEAQASGLPCLISDNITRNVQLTSLPKYLPVTDMTAWLNAFEIESQKKRTGCSEEDQRKLRAFDAKEVARKLSAFYLKLYGENGVE